MRIIHFTDFYLDTDQIQKCGDWVNKTGVKTSS